MIPARRWLVAALVGLGVLLVCGRVVAGVYADWTWYDAMGALAVYQARLLYGCATHGIAFVAGFTLAFLNLYAVRRSIVSLVLPRQLGDLEIGEAIPNRLLDAIVLAVSLLFGLLLALPQIPWTMVALARYGQAFKEIDPYLERDLGFYVYQLPFEWFVQDWILVAVLLTGLVAIGLYIVTPSVRWNHGRWYVSVYVRRHIKVLALVVIALLGWRYRLSRLSALVNGENAAPLTRALYTRRAFGVDAIVDADSAHAPVFSRETAARGVSTWDPAALVRSASTEDALAASAIVSWMVGPDGLIALVARPPAVDRARWPVASFDATGVGERNHALPWFGAAPSPEHGLSAPLVEDRARPYLVIGDSGNRIPAPPFSGWGERLGHAWHMQDPRLLALEPPPQHPRIVYRRNLRERVRALVPFFTMGSTVMPVVWGDSLYWIVELYATTDAYPLAIPIAFGGEAQRYVRHAATAVVHAQTGRVTLVADIHPDPIARSWMRRFPHLFSPAGTFPVLLGAVRPPRVDWALLQGRALAAAKISRSRHAPAALALADGADPEMIAGGPFLFAAPGGAESLAWSLGVLDTDGRVIGVLMARGGAMPRTEWHRARDARRWHDVLASVRHAADSAGFSRSGQAAVGRGQWVPTVEGLFYAQSFYEWPVQGPPSLIGTVVQSANGTHGGPTFAEALGVAPSAVVSGGAFNARVAALYAAMSAALRQGDWQAFGQAFATLGRLLRSAP